MAARDLYHYSVKHALLKDGWTITDDPLEMTFLGIAMYIDLATEKVFAAEKDGKKIAVEIKSFLGSSLSTNFHEALGQYMKYLDALENLEPERKLYLAIPIDIYDTFFTSAYGVHVIKKFNLKLIVYKPTLEVISQWIH